MDRVDSVRSILKSNNVMNVNQNYDFQVGQIMHKAVYNDMPITLQEILTLQNDFFFFKNSRIKQTHKSLFFAGPKIWNNLPPQLVQESNFKKFKTCLRQFVLDN